MKEGWLVRGLEAAKTQAQQFPEYRVKALSKIVEFHINPSSAGTTKDRRAKPRAKTGS